MTKVAEYKSQGAYECTIGIYKVYSLTSTSVCEDCGRYCTNIICVAEGAYTEGVICNNCTSIVSYLYPNSYDNPVLIF